LSDQDLVEIINRQGKEQHMSVTNRPGSAPGSRRPWWPRAMTKWCWRWSRTMAPNFPATPWK
jgi:hypothetical protein